MHTIKQIIEDDFRMFITSFKGEFILDSDINKEFHNNTGFKNITSGNKLSSDEMKVILESMGYERIIICCGWKSK